MREDLVLSGDRNVQVIRGVQPGRERIKHLLVGSPKVVKRTIYTLHVKGYADASFWSKPVAANNLGEPGEVVTVLIRYVSIE